MKRLLWIFAAVAILGLAADRPVATITTSEPFAVNGVRMSAAGVSSWPLAAGDEVTTMKGNAVISIPNQGRIAIDKDSKLRLDRAADGTVIRLTAGAMRYKLEPKARIQLFAGDHQIKAEGNSENGVSLRGQNSDSHGPDLDKPGKPPGKPPGRSKGEKNH